MLETIKAYRIICDACGEQLDYCDYGIWEDEGAAIDAALDSDWTQSDDGKKWACCNCVEIAEGESSDE